MSPRYQLVATEPADLVPGDRIHTRLNVPGATHVTEYVVINNEPASETLLVVDAYVADGPTTHLRYTEWLFEKAEA